MQAIWIQVCISGWKYLLYFIAYDECQDCNSNTLSESNRESDGSETHSEEESSVGRKRQRKDHSDFVNVSGMSQVKTHSLPCLVRSKDAIWQLLLNKIRYLAKLTRNDWTLIENVQCINNHNWFGVKELKASYIITTSHFFRCWYGWWSHETVASSSNKISTNFPV